MKTIEYLNVYLDNNECPTMIGFAESFARQQYSLSNESKVRRILNRKIESLETEKLDLEKQNTELAELLKKAVRIVKQMDANVKGTLPSHIKAGEEAKKYADEMNSKGEHNGFHELDFYNGIIWLRDIIEGKNQ